MLRRAENVQITLVPHLFSGRGHVRLQIGRKLTNFNKFRMSGQDFRAFLIASHNDPFRFKVGNAIYWLFENKFYKDSDGLSKSEVKALLIARNKMQQSRINRAKTIAALDVESPKTKRGTIPDDVKLLVWERDRGKCAKCGSTVELQYDHIIPISLGGASTPENLQILCGQCNRAKSASVV